MRDKETGSEERRQLKAKKRIELKELLVYFLERISIQLGHIRCELLINLLSPKLWRTG